MDEVRHFRHFTYVPVGDGAAMCVPAVGENSLEWSLRYAPPAKDTSMAAAPCLASYTYLLLGDISDKEVLRRVKLLRKALKDNLVAQAAE